MPENVVVYGCSLLTKRLWPTMWIPDFAAEIIAIDAAVVRSDRFVCGRSLVSLRLSHSGASSRASEVLRATANPFVRARSGVTTSPRRESSCAWSRASWGQSASAAVPTELRRSYQASGRELRIDRNSRLDLLTRVGPFTAPQPLGASVLSPALPQVLLLVKTLSLHLTVAQLLRPLEPSALRRAACGA